MRDIKFRGYDPVKKEMRFADICEVDEIGEWITWDLPIDSPTNTGTGWDIMQFTGLTDKNGVDIYEGDIVKFCGDWVEQPNKEVIFDDEFHSYVLLSGQEKDWVASGSNHYKYWSTDEDNIYLLHQAESYEVEVIGNIHENQELIGG